MRKIVVLILFLYSSLIVAADGRVLNVGVNYFSPPFIMRSGDNVYYGFDISMMNYVCGKINRECRFYSMPFNDLLLSVEDGRVDIAVSALTITRERAQFVRFSNPYLLSYSRFLGNIKFKDVKFTRKFFRDKTIGLKKGSVFSDEIRQLNLRKVKIKQYVRDNEMIDALSQGDVDFALMDNEKAVYWENHSAGQLKAFGPQIKYGNGYGIVVNLKDEALIQQINDALALYHKSMYFRSNYITYIATFPGN